MNLLINVKRIYTLASSVCFMDVAHVIDFAIGQIEMNSLKKKFFLFPFRRIFFQQQKWYVLRRLDAYLPVFIDLDRRTMNLRKYNASKTHLIRFLFISQHTVF